MVTVPHQNAIARRKLIRDTVIGTLVALAGSLILATASRVFLEGASILAIYVVSVVWSLAIAAPLVAYSAWQRHRAHDIATLTGWRDHGARGLLGPTAFAGAIKERRRRAQSGAAPTGGAVLLLDVANLRRISAQYGADWSGAVIDLVAGVIRRAVRADDIVGRLDSGEFSAFLWDATEMEAVAVAERIRKAVAEIYFSPGDDPVTLDFRIVGVNLDDQASIGDALRVAEQQLLEDAGSNGDVHFQSLSGRVS